MTRDSLGWRYRTFSLHQRDPGIVFGSYPSRVCHYVIENRSCVAVTGMNHVLLLPEHQFILISGRNRIYRMTRYKRTSHSRPSTPARLASRIYAHTSPIRTDPRYQRRHKLKQKHSRKLRGYEDDSEDTYLSFLRAIHDTEDDDYARNPDETDIDASSDDQEWDEEATLVEMLGSP